MPKSFSDITYDTIFGLFKGEPGLRKSSAAASFPKPYFFDVDGKMDALHAPIKAWGINPADIEYDTYTVWNGPESSYNVGGIIDKLEKFKVNCKYKTLVIDSITSTADAINRQTLKIKGLGDGPHKRIAGIPVNSIEDFNAEDSALKELIASLKEIRNYHKIHIILIAHVIQKEMKSSTGQTHMSRTIVTAGKGIAQKIPAYCSEIYHFNVFNSFNADAGGQYGLYTVHTGDDMARTSLPLPEKIIFNNDPLYSKWIEPAIEKMRPTTITKQPTEQKTTFITKG